MSERGPAFEDLSPHAAAQRLEATLRGVEPQAQRALSPTSEFAVRLLHVDSHRHGRNAGAWVRYDDAVRLFHAVVGGAARVET